MEDFCLGIFANADKADRASPTQPPEIALAGRFYVSALFFDVLTQFYPDRILPPDLENMRRYARYRTIQIRNRKPIDPDTAGQQPASSSSPVAITSSPAVKAAVSAGTGFKYVDDDEDERPAAPVTAKPSLPAVRAPVTEPVSLKAQSVPTVAEPVKSGGEVSRADAMAAKKKLQQAISAIDFADYPTACALSREALQLITPK